MKPKILVTREVFDETLEMLGRHFEVTSNQSDAPLTAEELAARLVDGRPPHGLPAFAGPAWPG